MIHSISLRLSQGKPLSIFANKTNQEHIDRFIVIIFLLEKRLVMPILKKL
jgi:hypothetical protein